jgi:hypothetical protein
MTPDAVKAVVDRAPELTDDQRARIRAILLPAVPTAETLVPTEYDDGPGTRRGRRDHLAAAKTKRGRSHATPP